QRIRGDLRWTRCVAHREDHVARAVRRKVAAAVRRAAVRGDDGVTQGHRHGGVLDPPVLPAYARGARLVAGRRGSEIAWSATGSDTVEGNRGVGHRRVDGTEDEDAAVRSAASAAASAARARPCAAGATGP